MFSENVWYVIENFKPFLPKSCTVEIDDSRSSYFNTSLVIKWEKYEYTRVLSADNSHNPSVYQVIAQEARLYFSECIMKERGWPKNFRGETK